MLSLGLKSESMRQHCRANILTSRSNRLIRCVKRDKSITVCSANVQVKISVAQSSLKLDLSNCNLESVPLEVFEIEDLEELSLAGNNLRELPAQVSGLTGLQRLQLAGNCLSSLPPGICQLQKLQGLWLHGNLLQSLPEHLGALTSLEQLSLSGNCISELPASISGLSSLRELGLAGNKLQQLPAQVSGLSALTILSLHGNRLQALPSGLSALHSLKELWLQGNCLTQLGDAVQGLKALKELSVADNALQELPLGGHGQPLVSLEKLWAYGNHIHSLPSDLHLRVPNIKTMWLEANPLDREAVENVVAAAEKLPSLSALGLDTTQVVHLQQSQAAALGSRLKVGHVIGQGPGYFKLQPGPSKQTSGTAYVSANGTTASNTMHSSRGADASEPSSRVSSSRVSSSRVSSSRDCYSLDQLETLIEQRKNNKTPLMLVVAFGSAPGTPNWGGALGKVMKEVDEEVATNVDVLYIVDPFRDWYGGGETDGRPFENLSHSPSSKHGAGPDMDARGEVIHEDPVGASENGPNMSRRRRSRAARMAEAAQSQPPPDHTHLLHHFDGLPPDDTIRSMDIAARLRKVTGMYDRVLMIGDSMGATGALLFSPLATSVHAFCPQLDLITSSIRPGRSPRWSARLKGTVLERVAQCGGKVVVHTGYWQHDLDQANLLPKDAANVHVKVYPVDSHRLALYLDSRKKLVPLLRDAILQELGIRTGNVRLTNLV